MSRRGLPQTTRMRHDAHYVEALAGSPGEPVGRTVSIELLDPNPDQPRQAMGDLSELMASIEAKGVIEPLIVRRREAGRFQIIAGERRYQAAVQVGLQAMPVIIRDADDRELIELALIENIQRKDLTPFEEAEALQALADRFEYTHEQLARRLGKSRTAITESLSLAAMPPEVKRLCGLADIASKSILLQIARQADPQKMIELIDQIARSRMTRADVRKTAAKPAAARRRPFAYQYVAPSKAFSVRLQFRKSRVERDELIQALEELLTELRQPEAAS